MASEWVYSTLGEIAEGDGRGLVDGPFGSNLPVSDYVADGIPVIRGSNLTIGNARFVDDEFVFVSQATAQRLSRSLCKGGDIVFTKKGTLGQTGFIPSNHRYPQFLLSSNQMKLTVDRSVADPLFVYYYVSSDAARAKIVQDATQTGVPKTNVAYLRAFPILLPRLCEQQRIAALLNALDDKIEQNRRTAQVLERLARAIFRAWFVNFEPIKAKAEGATSFPSMPQAVFDALPTRFVDSDIGPVPEGWEVKALGEVVNLTMGQSPKSEFYNQHGEGLPFHQGVSDHGFRFPTRRVYCTIEGRLADAGDILLSVRAPVGRINVADVKMVLGRGLAGLRHRSGRQSFLLYQMQHLFSEDDTMGEGTIYKSVNKKYLNEIPLLVESGMVEDAFERVAKPIDQMITSAINESHKLTEMRDYLLPKLMNGSVRVRDATNVPENPPL